MVVKQKSGRKCTCGSETYVFVEDEEIIGESCSDCGWFVYQEM